MTMDSRGSTDTGGPARPRVIVLYVCDSLRPDHLSCYGYRRLTSPNIDRLAADGVLFRRAFAESTWTRPVAASLMSSLYPPTHGVLTLYDALHEDIPTLAGALRERGYGTVGLSAMSNVSALFGFANGFDTFEELFRDPGLAERRGDSDAPDWYRRVAQGNCFVRPRGQDINDRAFDLLADRAGEPVLLFAWAVDTHYPYAPPPQDRVFLDGSDSTAPTADLNAIRAAASPEEVRRLRDLYDCEIHAGDRAIGDLIDWLKDIGVYDRTLFVVVGDHGEAFVEHGRSGHGGYPYDEQIAVPLVIKMPGQRYAGTRVDGLVQLVDVAPTILEAIGADPHPGWQGKSLLAAMQGAPVDRTAAYCHLRMPRAGRDIWAVRTARYKLMQVTGRGSPGGSLQALCRGLVKSVTGRRYRDERLLDTQSSPPEATNIISLAAWQRRLALAAHLRGWRDRCAVARRRLALVHRRRIEPTQDPKVFAHLRHLGYM